jgi:uncharacterized Fe-S center protein
MCAVEWRTTDSIVNVSHFMGHELTGFGGALKNLGIGKRYYTMIRV